LGVGIVEFRVGRQPEQCEERAIMSNNHWHRRRDHVGGVTAYHDIDFVDVQQLGVDARDRRWIRLVVVVNQLHLPPKNPAFGIDLFLPELHREQRRFAIWREASGQRHAESNRDRILRSRGERSDQQHDGEQCASQ
jgi:hypothetical protein